MIKLQNQKVHSKKATTNTALKILHGMLSTTPHRIHVTRQPSS